MKEKENKPEQGKVYRLTGDSSTPCIANGDTWEDSKCEDVEKEFNVGDHFRALRRFNQESRDNAGY